MTIFTKQSRLPLKAFLSVFLLCKLSGALAQTPSFPGAMGFGAAATGGRSGTVYHVTTLADSGPGSFRDAASQANRIIVFDVGGYITLKTAVSVKSNITIAGQTAPGGGIGFKGGEISFANSSNIICRYIRIRPGSETPSTTDDALSFYRSTNVIVDHCSIEFAPWNNIDGVSDDWQNHPVNSITVQNSLIADPTGQQFGAHTEAVNGTWSWYNNIFANSHNRNPLAKINTIFVNNVLYNCSAGYTTHTSTLFKHDIINNYFIFGPASTGTDNTWYQVDKNQSIYYSGNLKDNNLDGNLNGSATTPYWYQGPGTILTTPWSNYSTAYTPFTAETAYRYTVSLAGTFPRDPMDQLIVNQIKTLGSGTTGLTAGTTGPLGSLYTSQSQTGLDNNGYGTIASGDAEVDTDQDGMPDFWELATGSNKMVNEAMTLSSDGYTLIEHYLNWLSSPHTRTSPNTSSTIDLSAYAEGFLAVNPVYTITNTTNGTATLGADGHTLTFNPTSDFTGLAEISFTVSGNDGTSYSDKLVVAVATSPSASSVVKAPSNLTLNAITVDAATPYSTVSLTWTDNSGNEDNFILERSTDGTNFSQVSQPAANAVAYTDDNLQPNTTYYYRIKAVNASTSSVYSSIVSVKTPLPPSQPTATLTPTPANGYQYTELTSGSVALKWTGNSNTTTYSVYFGTDAGNLSKLADVPYAATPSYTATSLTDNTTYYWRVDATNSKGTATGEVWSFRTIPAIPTGLVGQWSFDDAATSATLTDSSTYHNNAILNLNADYQDLIVSGKSKNGLDFSTASTNTYVVSIPNKDQLFLDKSSFSISFWMKAPSTLMPTNSTTSAYLLCKGSITRNAATGATGKRFDVEFKASRIRFSVDDDVNKDEFQGDATGMFTGQWVHVVVVRDQSNKKLLIYKNGAAMTALSGSSNASATKATGIGEASDLIIGNLGQLEFLASTNPSSPYTGMVDEVRVFNYVLSPAEITALANISTLPVHLISFTAEKEGSGVRLKWQTGAEENNNHYEVERSANGINFSSINTVSPSAAHSYSTIDNAPVNSLNYYRLVQYDNNGTSKILATKAVKFDLENYSNISVYPNPIAEVLNVRLPALEDKEVHFSIISMDGKTVFKATQNVNNNNDYQLKPGLNSGIYLLKVSSPGYSRNIQVQVK